MACNNCNPTPCVQQDCSCKIFISSDCVSEVKSVFECLEIETGLTLTQTLEEMDAQICALFDSITNYFTLINIGEGVGVYKGVNVLGQKEFKSLVKEGDLITITGNTSEISFSIDEAELTNFINNLIPIAPDFCVQSDSLEVTEEEGCFKVELSLLSDSLTVVQEEAGVFRIEYPQTTTIPALYVNSNYTPTYNEWLSENIEQNGVPVIGFEYIGRGTFAQPFTNTRVFTLNSPATPPIVTANTAIQNALDGDTVHSYVGSGTALTPDREGQQIVVQNNNTSYTFTGNLNYQNLNLKIEGYILSTTTGYIVDLDIPLFDAEDTVSIKIELLEAAILQIQGSGFNNSGNTKAGVTYATGKGIRLIGEGLIFSVVNDITKYIINSDITNTGNNNDGAATFEIRCILRADKQGIYRVGGVSRIDIYNRLISGSIVDTVDLFLRAYHQTGGQVRLFKDAIVGFNSSPDARRYAITFNPTGGFTPIFIAVSSQFGGNAGILFQKESAGAATLQVTDSNSSYGLNIGEIFDGTVASWNILFTNNIFKTGSSGIVDLTRGNTTSVVNTIGGRIVEHLVKFSTKASAQLSGVLPNSAFLIGKDVVATNLVEGEEYQIVSLGTTNFTLLGASATPFVGEYFTKNATAGLGTGVARTIRREVLL